MEALLGITGDGFALLASSRTAVRGITILKSSDQKTRVFNEHNVVAFSGEAGDTVHFCEYIQANVQLYGMRNNQELESDAVAAFTRNQLARSLRSRKPYQVNLLLAGYDSKQNKPRLYWIDYLAAMVDVPYGAHGYASYYCLSIMDRYHKPTITLEEGLDIMRKCTKEMETRMPIDFKGFDITVVTSEGISKREL